MADSPKPYVTIVVDDDEAICDVLCSYLSALPEFEAVALNDGTHCLTYLEDHVPPDIFIIDRMMPNMNGMELTRELRAKPETKRIPILMLTALSKTESVVEGFAAGVDDYLAKPFSLKEVAVRARALIDRSRELANLNPLLTRFEEHYSASQLAMLGDELQIARQIQTSLLPTVFPHCPYLEFGACIKPATIVGGDFYDFFQVKADEIFVVVGDVMGKGIPAAMIMLMVRVFIRTLLQEGYSLQQVVEKLNIMLTRDTSSETFVSMIGLSLTWEKGVVICEMVNGGHRRPLRLYLNSDEVDFLPTTGGLLGLFPDTSWETYQFHVQPGFLLALYTDGMVHYDSQSDTADLASLSWLEKLIRQNNDQSVQHLCQLAVETSSRMTRSEDLTDDQTIVILRTKF